MFSQLKATFKEVIREGVREATEKIRREIDHRAVLAPSSFEGGSDFTSREEQTRSRIADLKVFLREAQGIPAHHFENSGTVGTSDTYCVVSVEQTKRSTNVVRKSLNPVWNHEMVFKVTDLNSDIVIQVYSMKSLGGLDVDSKIIGQAIIPVARLLPDLTAWALHSNSFIDGKDTTPLFISRLESLEIFPLPKELSKFQSIPDELAVDLKGMIRPRTSLGTLNVSLELTLSAPLLQLYFSCTPAPPWSRLTAGQATNRTDAEVLDINVIKWNIIRIRAALTRPPAWWAGVELIRSWESPAFSLCALLSVVLTILMLPLWLTPSLVAFVAVALSLYGSRVKARDPTAGCVGEVRTWHREVARDPKEPTTIVGKALLGKALILRVQRETGSAASALERARNALAWADPNLSIILCLTLAALGIAASVAVRVAGPLLAVIPPRWIVVALVAPSLFPPGIREKMRPENNPVLGPLLRDVRQALGAPAMWHETAAAGAGAGDAESEDMDSYVNLFSDGSEASGGGVARGRPARDGAGESGLGPVGRGVLALRRVYAHVPDRMEVTHRVIATRQLKQALPSNPSLPTAAGLAGSSSPMSPAAPPGSTLSSAASRSGKGPLVLGRKGGESAVDQLEREVAAELASQTAGLGRGGEEDLGQAYVSVVSPKAGRGAADGEEGGDGGEGQEETQLELLAQMGFGDAAENRALLREVGGNLTRVVDRVLASRRPKA